MLFLQCNRFNVVHITFQTFYLCVRVRVKRRGKGRRKGEKEREGGKRERDYSIRLDPLFSDLFNTSVIIRSCRRFKGLQHELPPARNART